VIRSFCASQWTLGTGLQTRLNIAHLILEAVKFLKSASLFGIVKLSWIRNIRDWRVGGFKADLRLNVEQNVSFDDRDLWSLWTPSHLAGPVLIWCRVCNGILTSWKYRTSEGGQMWASKLTVCRFPASMLICNLNLRSWITNHGTDFCWSDFWKSCCF